MQIVVYSCHVSNLKMEINYNYEEPYMQRRRSHSRGWVLAALLLLYVGVCHVRVYAMFSFFFDFLCNYFVCDLFVSTLLYVLYVCVLIVFMHISFVCYCSFCEVFSICVFLTYVYLLHRFFICLFLSARSLRHVYFFMHIFIN